VPWNKIRKNKNQIEIQPNVQERKQINLENYYSYRGRNYFGTGKTLKKREFNRTKKNDCREPRCKTKDFQVTVVKIYLPRNVCKKIKMFT